MMQLPIVCAFLTGLRMPLQHNDLLWQIVSVLGTIAFFSRFFVQWLYSEKHKVSKVPTIFWYQSIVGASLMLAYTLRQHEWVLALGYIGTVVPYSRNLVLVYRKRRNDELQHASNGADGEGLVDPNRR